MAVYTGLVNFGWTFFFQIANTIIIFLVLKKILFKPVREFMTARQKGIEDTINEADSIHNNAMALKAEYETKLSQVKEEGREIIKDARHKADEQAREIIKESQEKASMMINHAENEIKRENVKAMNELKDEITSLAFMTAEKILKKKLSEKDHNELIKEFVEEVGETEWQS